LRGTITTRRFASWPLVMAVLAASACGEGPLPEVVNEPAEVAQLRAAGKNPREIRNELRAEEFKKFKGAKGSARRTN
jgi:hypothetical protein